MKNALIYIAIIILAIPVALGAEVSVSPVEIYESVESDFNIDVNNYLGPNVINKVELQSPDLEVSNVMEFIGWSSDFSPSQITWSGGRIENNVQSALFVYSAKAPLVDSDTQNLITGTLTYADTSTEVFSINVTVKNDSSPPVLNSISPADKGYVRAHSAEQLIIINASDPETGIRSVSYSYSDCSGNATGIVLDCMDGYCSGLADFSGYDEDDTACFNVEITNNAGNVLSGNGSFGFDETPPVVSLISPVNNSYSNNMFSFEVSDNKASEFKCQMEIDNNMVQDVEAFEGVNAFALNASISEGMHDWKITCADAVGLEGSDEDSFIYDITAPVITLTSPANGSAIKDEIIGISVADNYELSSVDYSKDLDSSSWPDGWNSLEITAVDMAGNTAVSIFDFYVDKQAPVLELISPEDNASFDYHGEFFIKATDDFDEIIECGLSTSTGNNTIKEVESGKESVINAVLPLGQFSWYVLCVDDVGNSVQSETRTATAKDLSGPVISINAIDYVARGTDLEVAASIEDISGVKSAVAKFNGQEISLIENNGLFTGSFSVPAGLELGDYSVEVAAVDTNDLDNSAFEDFTVVEYYDISFSLPSSASPSESVAITGSVIRDDSSFVNSSVDIAYPGGVSEVALDENSEFTYEFTAPDTAGEYDVKVSYETEFMVYSRTETLVVSAPQQAGNNQDSSSGIPFDYQGEYSGVKPEESAPEPSSEPEAPSASGGENLNVPEEPVEEEISEQEPRTPLGAGQATGLFNNLGSTVKWGVILLTALGLVLGGVYSFRKSRKKNSKIDWGSKFS